MSSITLTAQTAEVHGMRQKPLRKRNWECIHATKRMMAGFPHLYYMASPHLALEFLEQCVSYRKEQEENKMKTALAALIVGYGLDLLLGDPSFL